MRSVEDLEKNISLSESVLATLPENSLSGVRKALENEIARDKKRILDIRANVAKLGDGSPATIGTVVFRASIPSIDKAFGPDGKLLPLTLEKRKVAMTKKLEDKAYLYFGAPTAKYERLPKYEASLWFSNELEAKGNAQVTVEAQLVELQAELDRMTLLATSVKEAKFKVADMTEDK